MKKSEIREMIKEELESLNEAKGGPDGVNVIQSKDNLFTIWTDRKHFVEISKRDLEWLKEVIDQWV